MHDACDGMIERCKNFLYDLYKARYTVNHSLESNDEFEILYTRDKAGTPGDMIECENIRLRGKNASNAQYNYGLARSEILDPRI